MKRSEKEYIEVVVYWFGMTRKEALQYIRNAETEILEELLNGYRAECKKNFYSD